MHPDLLTAADQTQLTHWNPAKLMSEQRMEGFGPVRNKRSSPAHVRQVMEFGRLMADVAAGRTDPAYIRLAANPPSQHAIAMVMESYPGLYPQSRSPLQSLKETMSVTDYQALYIDVLDRMYYGFYNGWPVSTLGICKVHDLRDFRIVSRFLLDGLVTPMDFTDAAAPAAEQALSGPVPQDNSTFPTTNTAPIQYQPRMAQAKAATNWRAVVNDDLGIFRDIPKRLAIAGNRRIQIFINTLFTAFGGITRGVVTPGAGFNTALYNSSYGNIINTANGASVNNPPLGAQGLMDAFKILAGMKDSSGNPIMITGRMKVVYGPSNYAVAKNLQNMITNHVSVEGGSQNSQGFPTQWLETNSWVKDNVDWILDPYIQAPYNTNAGSWFVFIDPDTLERPSLEIGFLTGYRTPQMYQKVPNTMRVGGGVEPMMGDFDTMDSEIKILTVFGGTQIDGRGTVASNGTGA